MENIPEKKCKESNRTIIRIWTSRFYKSNPGQDLVGHISIETKNYYMSLWPDGTPNEKTLKQVFEDRKADFMTFEQDKEQEERDPEITVCLYSLSIKRMEMKFAELKEKMKNWTLLGNNVLLIKDSTQHSCASLAYEILDEGEIHNLISSAYSSKYSSVVSPDILVKAIKAAKIEEQKQYEKTKKFNFSSETKVKFISKNSENRCSMWHTIPAVVGGVALASYLISEGVKAYFPSSTK